VASWRQDPPGTVIPSWEREAAEHLAILQAAESGDPGHAAALLRAHIAAFLERNLTDGPHELLQEKNP
jgi:DNA-binding GntR family transcriptional regulator